MANSVGERINAIISETIRKMKGLNFELTDEISLIDGGILDSLSVVNVIQELQEEFGIEIMVEDITLENFDTVGLIKTFVEARMN